MHTKTLDALRTARKFIESACESASPDIDGVNEAALRDVDEAIAALESGLPSGMPSIELTVRGEEQRFFSYSPDNGALWHPTAAEASEASNLDIAYYRDAANSDGEWSPDVENVCWGEVRGRAVAETDDLGSDYLLRSETAPFAADEQEQLTVAALSRTGRVKAGEVLNVMRVCGLGGITLNQRLDVDAVAKLLDHLIDRATPSEPEHAALPQDVELQAYRVGRGRNAITVERATQRQGPDLWAVRQDGDVLNKDGAWEYEPMPSSRDEDFMARCRYASALDALRAVKAHEAGKAVVAT